MSSYFTSSTLLWKITWWTQQKTEPAVRCHLWLLLCLSHPGPCLPTQTAMPLPSTTSPHILTQRQLLHKPIGPLVSQAQFSALCSIGKWSQLCTLISKGNMPCNYMFSNWPLLSYHNTILTCITEHVISLCRGCWWVFSEGQYVAALLPPTHVPCTSLHICVESLQFFWFLCFILG